jgi:hypothetical protein
MKNKPFLIRLIRWQAQSFLRWRHLFLPLALFLLIGWYATLQTAQLSMAPANISVWDVALVAFGGPGADDNSFVRMLVWFMPHLLQSRDFVCPGPGLHRLVCRRGFVDPGVPSGWQDGRVFSLDAIFPRTTANKRMDFFGMGFREFCDHPFGLDLVTTQFIPALA